MKKSNFPYMMKKIGELESLLGYRVEILFNEDGERVMIKSGGNKPPEQEGFFKEFETREDAKAWLNLMIAKQEEK